MLKMGQKNIVLLALLGFKSLGLEKNNKYYPKYDKQINFEEFLLIFYEEK